MGGISESGFLALVDAILERIESGVEKIADETDVDIEATRNGNVLTLEFARGAKIVVNSQAPLQEIWVAARSGGFHYRNTEAGWCDTRGGEELFAALNRLVSEQAGLAVSL